jgi:hypothetical protein
VQTSLLYGHAIKTSLLYAQTSGLTLLVRRRKPFFYFMPGYPGASRAFAIRKLLIAAACDTRIRVSQAGWQGSGTAASAALMVVGGGANVRARLDCGCG